jgi:hypothetical protein
MAEVKRAQMWEVRILEPDEGSIYTTPDPASDEAYLHTRRPLTMKQGLRTGHIQGPDIEENVFAETAQVVKDVFVCLLRR